MRGCLKSSEEMYVRGLELITAFNDNSGELIVSELGSSHHLLEAAFRHSYHCVQTPPRFGGTLPRTSCALDSMTLLGLLPNLNPQNDTSLALLEGSTNLWELINDASSSCARRNEIGISCYLESSFTNGTCYFPSCSAAPHRPYPHAFGMVSQRK